MKKHEFIQAYIEGAHGFLVEADDEKIPLIRCKDCGKCEIQESWKDIGHGVKMLTTEKTPECTEWKRETTLDGYCHKAVPKREGIV